MIMNIFISHSSEDASIATNLCNTIEKYGDCCFIAPRNIRTGYEYAAEIAEGIDHSDILILLLSKAANASPHVLREVERAVTKSIPVLVYKLEDVELSKSMEYFLMTHQWLNAQKNDFSDIIQSISQFKKNKVDAEYVEVMSSPREQSKKILIIPILIIAVAFISCILGTIVAITISENNEKNNPTTADNSQSDATTQDNEPTDDESTDDVYSTTEDSDSNTLVKAELGDTIVLGTYYDEPIEWKVIKISEDGQSAVLISKYVLCFKGYDAPDKGSFGGEPDADTDLEIQAYARGNSSWESSTIRTWLNSNEEFVVYEGQPPKSQAFADSKNGYQSEPGFLTNFSENELKAILEVPIETNGNALSTEETITTYDKVFLLSKDELEWLNEAGVHYLANPTKKAINNNETFWYKDYSIGFNYTAAPWWLREPVEGFSSRCYLVDYGKYDGQLFFWEVGVESFGIRPAITVDLTSKAIKIN